MHLAPIILPGPTALPRLAALPGPAPLSGPTALPGSAALALPCQAEGIPLTQGLYHTFCEGSQRKLVSPLVK